MKVGQSRGELEAVESRNAVIVEDCPLPSGPSGFQHRRARATTTTREGIVIEKLGTARRKVLLLVNHTRFCGFCGEMVRWRLPHGVGAVGGWKAGNEAYTASLASLDSLAWV